MANPQQLSHYIRQFLTTYMTGECNRSDNTIIAYRDTLRLFLRFILSETELNLNDLLADHITPECVRHFLDYLEEKRKCSINTRNARLAAIKSFCAYMGRELPEYLELSRQIHQIRNKQTVHKTAQYLEDHELKAILEHIESDTNNRHQARDRALLMLMYNTGARVTEIVDLTLADLRLDQTPQVHILGKGRKQRSTPLWPETVADIKTYLDQRSPADPNETKLFLNNHRHPIGRFGIRYIIRKYTNVSISDIPSLVDKNVTPHTIRHTTAMHLLQAGNELNMIRLWLGHASLTTTHMYVEIDMKTKKKILESVTPPNITIKTKEWQQPDILKWLDELISPKQLCEANQSNTPQKSPSFT